MTITTEASATVAANSTFATLAHVPQYALVAISLSGIGGSTVVLQAQWNEAGAWETQKSWTADPTEAVHFEAPRACGLRLGCDTGYVAADSISTKIGYDYPIRKN